MDDEKLKFPIDLLPDFIKNYVIEISEEYQTPTEMAFQACLSALSTSANGFLGVRTGPSFVEPGVIWTLTSAEPGERKGVVRKAYEPIYSLQTQAQKRAEQDRRNYEENTKPEKARLTKILHKAMERGDSDVVIEGLQNKIKNFGYEPSFPDYIVDDITVEALAEVLRDNDEVLSIVDTEGTYLKVMSGIYNKGQVNLGFPNKCFDMEPASSKRKGGGGVSLFGPALTNCLFIQPEIINKLKNSDFIGSGFIQRFLFIQIDEAQTKIGSRDHRNIKLADSRITQDWDNRISAMFTHYRDMKSMSNFIGKSSLHVLELEQSKELYLDFLQKTELRFKKDGDFNGSFAQFGSKLAGKLARVALFYEAGGAIDLNRITQVSPSTVSAENMERALGLGEYYVEHAKALWGVMSGTKTVGREEDNKRNVILKWIVKNAEKTDDGFTKPFTAAEINRSIRSKISPFQSIKDGPTATDQIAAKLDEMVNEYSGQLVEDEVNSGVLRRSGPKTKKYKAVVTYAGQLYAKVV